MSVVSAFTATTSAVAIAFVAVPVRAEDVFAGVWQGSYLCLQGETQLRLTVFPAGGNPSTRRAFFYFTPRLEADDRSAGCFTMRGAEGLPGFLRLRQDAWIRKPPNYVMVDLEGRIGSDGAFAGTIDSPGCGAFSLTKVLPEPDESTACEPFSQ